MAVVSSGGCWGRDGVEGSVDMVQRLRRIASREEAERYLRALGEVEEAEKGGELMRKTRWMGMVDGGPAAARKVPVVMLLGKSFHKL